MVVQQRGFNLISFFVHYEASHALLSDGTIVMVDRPGSTGQVERIALVYSHFLPRQLFNPLHCKYKTLTGYIFNHYRDIY